MTKDSLFAIFVIKLITREPDYGYIKRNVHRKIIKIIRIIRRAMMKRKMQMWMVLRRVQRRTKIYMKIVQTRRRERRMIRRL
jgi:hypothetical protein